MKKLLPIVIALFSICGLAQAPNGFNYQASVRDANGDLVTEQSVSFKFHIIQTDCSIFGFSQCFWKNFNHYINK